MPATSLTDRFVSALAGNGARQEYQDTKVRGLVLRVSPTGDPKSWSFVFRDPITKAKQRITLGVYPGLTLADARTAAQGHIGSLSKGINPLGEMKQARAAAKAEALKEVKTVADLVQDYLRRDTSGHRGAAEKRRRMEVNLVARLGDMPLDRFHRSDVSRLLDDLKVAKVETRKTATGKTRKVKTGGPALASRLYDDLKRLSRWAVSAGLMDQDILAPLERPAKAKARERALSRDELAQVLRRLDASGMTDDMQRCLRLLVLTGCRESEIAELVWSEVDLEAGLLQLPPERVKNDPRREEQRGLTVPLPRRAIAILEEQRRALEGDELRRAKRQKREPRPLGEAVFPSARGDGPMEGRAVGVAWRRSFPSFGIAHATVHDLRRTVATRMAEDLDVWPHVVEAVLNHVSGSKAGVAGTYNRARYSAAHQEALARWVDYLDEIEHGPSNVIRLPTGRAS